MARNILTMAGRIKIITLMEQNMRQVDVANILHVNQSIVSRLWRKFQETQSIAYRPREGRPRKTTPGQDRRLHDIGLYARRPLKTPALCPHHRGARARWARAHENWTRGQWTRTLFSDEVRMGLHPDNNSIHVWRRTGERNHPSMTVERHQQFGGSILFWAGVMFGRRTPLVSIEGNMTAAVYENNILQPIVSGFAETVGEGFTLQDDNARPHRAHSVQRYLVEHGIRRMDWPACSPDMNCIEHAWSFLRRAISNRPHHPLTIQESYFQSSTSPINDSRTQECCLGRMGQFASGELRCIGTEYAPSHTRVPQVGARMKCEAVWQHQQHCLDSGSSVDPLSSAEVPSLVGLDWLFEHTDSEPDDIPHSNPGEFHF
ncbi:hypothetical protein ANN_24619 [Periplaneta americana]|uniref:Tc1-like transposase DDE domain-containing protein n=1 Tax=Periplaneta americana TaxID=6978 RepID=A0ABQ8S3T8_PERAM|nr:hypothetical protein ANN_24619 [Periplaneta americana]